MCVRVCVCESSILSLSLFISIYGSLSLFSWSIDWTSGLSLSLSLSLLRRNMPCNHSHYHRSSLRMYLSNTLSLTLLLVPFLLSLISCFHHALPTTNSPFHSLFFPLSSNISLYFTNSHCFFLSIYPFSLCLFIYLSIHTSPCFISSAPSLFSLLLLRSNTLPYCHC